MSKSLSERVNVFTKSEFLSGWLALFLLKYGGTDKIAHDKII